MTGPLDNYLVVGALLFVIGALGFLTRRSLILMMLSAELMLHGVSLNLVAFSATHRNYQGQAFTAFILTVAACEAALALALILVLYRRRKTLDVRAWAELSESPWPTERQPEDQLVAPVELEPHYPRLTPTGHVPAVTDGLGPGYGGNGQARRPQPSAQPTAQTTAQPQTVPAEETTSRA
jgi:NADH-quinone oxidoreductase subunit K